MKEATESDHLAGEGIVHKNIIYLNIVKDTKRATGKKVEIEEFS